MNDQVILKLFDKPDEVKNFDKGKFELVHMPNLTLGLGTYEPGWKWSTHVGVGVRKFCMVEHLGTVISGRATILMEDGTTFVMSEGMVFYIPKVPHDGWVEGDEPYVSLHILGADEYNKAIFNTP